MPNRALVLLAVLLLARMAALARPGLLVSGPMIAWCTPYETAIWVQTREAARVQVRYWPEGRPAVATLSGEVNTRRDHIALVRLEGLEPRQRYEYALILNGEKVDLPHPTTFRARPALARGSGPWDFRFAFGSCAYINEARRDGPGPAYGGDYRIFRAIDRLAPDFMIWLGDNTYLRSEEWTAESSMRERYRHDRALPELQPLLARTPQYALWDDHDYGPDDSDSTFALRGTALRVFSDYWPAQRYGPAGVPGCYQRFSWADVDFFLLDDRYHRDPNALPDGPGKAMLGREQREWLERGLAGSRATFKVVCMGSQALNPHMQYESWGHFPEERQAVLDFLAERKVAGVVFLTGDRHASELLRVERPGTYPLYEFTSSPLTSGAHRNEREADNPARVPGTWIPDRRSFGLIAVSGPRGGRRLTLTAHDADGATLWQHEIGEAELKP